MCLPTTYSGTIQAMLAGAQVQSPPARRAAAFKAAAALANARALQRDAHPPCPTAPRVEGREGTLGVAMLRAREAELCGVGVISKLLAGKRIPCLELVVVELQRKVDLGGVAGGEVGVHTETVRSVWMMRAGGAHSEAAHDRLTVSRRVAATRLVDITAT